jgi:formylglycine-generating enzyme required for sulfatase activity
MGRSKVTRTIGVCAALGAFFLLLAGCPLDLRSYVEWLKARDTLIPIDEILIASSGDSFGFGESGPIPLGFTHGFWMSKYEITNEQYQKFIADGGYTTDGYWTLNGRTLLHPPVGSPITQPSRWMDPIFNGPGQPVVGVSWHEAVAFCNWRSDGEGLTRAYDGDGRIVATADGYRLPTIVEWEYAAAKGEPAVPERVWPYGDTMPDASRMVFMASQTLPVGSKPAGDTPQGLTDMAGNAAEWCSDNRWSTIPSAGELDYYYFNDSSGATSFYLKGGSYFSATEADCSCANLASYDLPQVQSSMYGFRTVRGR